MAKDDQQLKVADLLDPKCSGVYTTGGSTTSQPLDIGGLIKQINEIREERDKLDAVLVKYIKDLVALQVVPFVGWALLLGVSEERLEKVLEGKEPPGWEMWERVKVFMLATEKEVYESIVNRFQNHAAISALWWLRHPSGKATQPSTTES
jgi:hypothetical protein